MNTLRDALALAAQTDRGLRFYDRTGNITYSGYAKLLDEATHLAGALRVEGIAVGDTVGLIFSTSYSMVRTLFAVIFAGGIPFCLAPPRLGRGADYVEGTLRMISKARAKLVITDDGLAGSLSKIVAQSGARFVSHTQIEGSTEFIYNASADTPALIQFSSGTTVDPKPVLLSHRNILANTSAILSRFPGRIEDHSGLSWLPLHHDMGLIGGLFTAVAGRGNITFVKPEDFVLKPVLWLRALTQTRATISPCPNFALKLCTERIPDEDLPGLDLSAWQIALVGAETVHLDTLTEFAAKFASTGFRFQTFTPVYGLAEATLAVTFSPVEESPLAITFDSAALGEGNAVVSSEGTRIVSVGTLLPGFEIEIRDESGKSLAPGNIGLIFLRGNSVIQRYFGTDHPATEKGDWLNTGDLGFFFEENLFLYGRAKDIIIINGRNHDPAYIEFATEGVPGLRHERTVAFPVISDTQATECFVVLVEKDKGDLRNQSDVAALVREAVSQKTGLVPESVHIIETGKMPRTTSGKVRRDEARKKFLSGELITVASK